MDQAACFKKRDGSKVDDLLCEASLKPAAGNSKACVLGACPERYYWNVTYSACSVSCEQGSHSLVMSSLHPVIPLPRPLAFHKSDVIPKLCILSDI